MSKPDPTRGPRVFGATMLGALALALALGASPARTDQTKATILIDVNAATVHELQLLPGVGPALAHRIIAEREEGGPFAGVDDLRRVRGVGERTIMGLRDLVALGP